MKWNLRMAAAERGIWKAAELQRKLAAAGLTVSAGKMSGWWSGKPTGIKFAELDVMCSVLGCAISDLMVAEPVELPATGEHRQAEAVGEIRAVTPRRKPGRSLPPR